MADEIEKPEGNELPNTQTQEEDDQKKLTLSQTELNKIIGERLAKEKANREEVLAELNTLRKKADMTANDKKAWEEKYNELVEKNMTAEELKERELLKAKKEKEEAETTLKTDRDKWQKHYFETLISNDVKDASDEHEAFSSRQIENNLRNFIKVVPMKDSSGNETGRYQTRVSFPDRKEDGTELILDMSVRETVARMMDMSEYKNLFKGKGTGGMGSGGNEELGKGTPEEYAARGPEAYRQAIKDGKIKF